MTEVENLKQYDLEERALKIFVLQGLRRESVLIADSTLARFLA